MNTNISLSVYLVDDGSTDGTGDAIKVHFPKIQVIAGNGELFWAGGMRKAYSAAVERGHDYYLWLNDDVELLPSALERSIEAHRKVQSASAGYNIIVGSMVDPETRATSYSGFRRTSKYFPFKFEAIEPSQTETQECATVNGNFVLVPHEVAIKTGPIHRAYRQTLADLDLGLKVGKIGGRCWLMPGYAGECKVNKGGRRNYKAPNLTLRQRIAMIEHPLGSPLVPTVIYSKHFGFWAPIVMSLPYAGLLKSLWRNR